MATQVIEWARDHDPDAVYIKRWLPKLRALPSNLAREPWLLISSGTETPAEIVVREGEDGWACDRCTLLNSMSRQTCAACGARGLQRSQSEFSALGIYASPPIVPPHPEEQGVLSMCFECNSEGLGYISDDDGSFYCVDCWATFAAEQSLMEQSDANSNSSVKGSVVAGISGLCGWTLVPDIGLPQGVSGTGAQLRDASISAAMSTHSACSPEVLTKGRSRWAVKGNRSEIVR